jgi:hypothetical protein
MISSARFNELERLVQAAVEDGADLVVGGGRWRNPYLEEGLYFSPTLLGNVSDQMEIAQTEGELASSHPDIRSSDRTSYSIRSDYACDAVRHCPRGHRDCE